MPKIEAIDSLFSLHGRVALVTGASGHLGFPMASALAQAGAHVILAARDENKLNEAVETLKRQSLSASSLVFDAADSDQLDRVPAAIGEQFNRLDILVNNAYAGPVGDIASSSAPEFMNAYAIAVGAAFSLCKSLLPLLVKSASRNSGGASVINIASMYGMVSPDPAIYGDSGKNNPPHYGAAKAGLIQLTKYLACHLGGQSIRVNSISPGPFPLPTIEQDNPAFFDALCKKNPLGRIGLSKELMGPLLFLASDAASYVTGTNLVVDGGWTAW